MAPGRFGAPHLVDLSKGVYLSLGCVKYLSLWGIWHLVDSSQGMYLSLWAGRGMYLSLGYGFKQRHVSVTLGLVDSSKGMYTCYSRMAPSRFKLFYSVDRLSPVFVACSVGVMYVQGVLALASEGARKAPPTKILVQRL